MGLSRTPENMFLQPVWRHVLPDAVYIYSVKPERSFFRKLEESIKCLEVPIKSLSSRAVFACDVLDMSSFINGTIIVWKRGGGTKKEYVYRLFVGRKFGATKTRNIVQHWFCERISGNHGYILPWYEIAAIQLSRGHGAKQVCLGHYVEGTSPLKEVKKWPGLQFVSVNGDVRLM